MKGFYSSKRWRTVSALVLDRDKNLCQMCKQNGKRVLAVCVHHIIPVCGEESDYDPDNCISLCAKCHTKQHGKASLEQVCRVHFKTKRKTRLLLDKYAEKKKCSINKFCNDAINWYIDQTKDNQYEYYGNIKNGYNGYDEVFILRVSKSTYKKIYEISMRQYERFVNNTINRMIESYLQCMEGDVER